jgi:hypothetical protein
MESPYPVANGNGNGEPSLEIALVKAEISALKTDISALTSAVSKLTEQGQWSLQKLGPLSFVGGILSFILILFIQNQTAPIASDVKGLQFAADGIKGQFGALATWQQNVNSALQGNTGDDERSKTDRAEMSRRVDRNSDELARLSSSLVANGAALTEVETQFRADELVASQRESNTEQWKGLFFQKLYGVPLPARGPVVPGIARAIPREGG